MNNNHKKQIHNDFSWRSSLQYLNAKFPLEYVYSGAYGEIRNPFQPDKGNVHARKTQGRQSTDVLVFFCFLFLFCFVFFLLLVNFYSLGPREDTANPESEFGIFSLYNIFHLFSRLFWKYCESSELQILLNYDVVKH